MGQVTTGLYALLGARSRSLKIHEWRKGKLERYSPPSSFTGLFRHSEQYLVAEAPSVPALWGSLFSALTQRIPLVLLPPSSPMERELLLAQLPSIPPAGSVLALFTSGSSGEPKAVFHSETSLLTSANQLAKTFPGSKPTACLLAPWGMAGVAFQCLLPAARGGTDIFISAEPLLDWGSEASGLFGELGVELLTLNPFLAEMLLCAGFGAGYQEQTVSLTAPLGEELKRRFLVETGKTLLEIYGMTEAAGPVLFEGKSLGAEIQLASDGELLLRGEQLFQGYATKGEFTARAEWFATGDIFTSTSGGFRHQCRTRELIDLGGRKVAPMLIEAAFTGMPELRECLVFPKLLSGVERAALAYAREASCTLTREELARLVDARAAELLSPELRPAWKLEMEKVPRLKNGKPDRESLRKLS